MEIVMVDPSGIEGAGHGFFIAAMGYERRSINAASMLPTGFSRRIAFGFDHNQVASYKSNLHWFQSNAYDVRVGLSSAEFREQIVVLCEELTRSLESRIDSALVVDISCFDRQRLAVIVDSLSRLPKKHKLRTFFLYSVAAFRPPKAHQGRNEVAGPVHPRFAGRFSDPGKPLALIAGLGYEVGKVVGAQEYLQASRVVAFFPDSPDKQFELAVSEANSGLLSNFPNEDLIRYSVEDLRRTVATLDSVIRGLMNSYNIVLLPGGPKIFVLACLLIQRMHLHAGVWRVSSGNSIAAHDVKGDGNVIAAEVRW